MKIIVFAALVAFLLVGNLACTKTSGHNFIEIDHTKNFVVFGYVAGECSGDCRALYLITDRAVLTDADQDVPLKETLFQIEPNYLHASKDAYKLLQVSQVILNHTYPKDALVSTVADLDYWIYGQIDGVEFTLEFDEIDATLSPTLYEYGALFKQVLTQLN